MLVRNMMMLFVLAGNDDDDAKLIGIFNMLIVLLTPPSHL